MSLKIIVISKWLSDINNPPRHNWSIFNWFLTKYYFKKWFICFLIFCFILSQIMINFNLELICLNLILRIIKLLCLYYRMQWKYLITNFYVFNRNLGLRGWAVWRIICLNTDIPYAETMALLLILINYSLIMLFKFNKARHCTIIIYYVKLFI